MCDFDLSQALEGPLESGDTGFEHCSCEAMRDRGKQDGVFNLDEGLDLVVSQQHKSMQRVANLVVVLNRMKKAPTSCSTDEQLCSMIMKNLVDEKIVTELQHPTMCEGRKTYQRVNSANQCTLCDISQKDVVQPPGVLELQAITLKGGSCYQKVGFKLARYISPCVATGASQTVALSIMNSNWHISCYMKGDTAVLHLEECSANNLKIINGDKGNDRFLFYKSVTGMSLTTFESVKYRGWFISTSSEDENKPVEMCKVDAVRRLTCFKVD